MMLTSSCLTFHGDALHVFCRGWMLFSWSVCSAHGVPGPLVFLLLRCHWPDDALVRASVRACVRSCVRTCKLKQFLILARKQNGKDSFHPHPTHVYANQSGLGHSDNNRPNGGYSTRTVLSFTDSITYRAPLSLKNTECYWDVNLILFSTEHSHNDFRQANKHKF